MSDALHLADAPTKTVGAAPAASDALTMADVLLRGPLVYVRQITESVKLLDAITVGVPVLPPLLEGTGAASGLEAAGVAAGMDGTGSAAGLEGTEAAAGLEGRGSLVALE